MRSDFVAEPTSAEKLPMMTRIATLACLNRHPWTTVPASLSTMRHPERRRRNASPKKFLIPLLHGDLYLLANMVRSVPDYPRPGIEFRHIVGIAEQEGGLSLCTSLLETHYSGDWTKIDRIVCCEAGGFVFASALAARVDVPLLLIREAGKLPPPNVSAAKLSSNISSSSAAGEPVAKRVEMNRDAVGPGTSVVIVDDVFATGKTLSAMINLLIGAGVHVTDISVLIVAGFPAHRGRELLRQAGFGGVNIQTLLIFGGL